MLEVSSWRRDLAKVLCGVWCCSLVAHAQAVTSLHETGAQVWIGPGDSATEIQAWFRVMSESHMKVARLFLMWPYLERRRDQWDFTEYDIAFRAAEQYHIRIAATLTPSGEPPFRGGDGSQGTGLPRSNEERQQAAVYIQKVVERYRASPALDSWLLMNEPGEKPHRTPLSTSAFHHWLQAKYPSLDALNAAWGSDIASFESAEPPSSQTNAWNFTAQADWYEFWRSFQTDSLQWLAQQVRRSDAKHPLHVNPHALLGNLAEVSDDLPHWRGLLDSLGCSIHPAWHFGLLGRDDYALGVSYVNDLVRGSIEPKPYWVTELQGGTNIYSGHSPMDPTADEISQWMWTSVAAGARRTIFWLLNSRKTGREAGEWSLLNNVGEPSERLRAASQVQATIDRHAALFSKAVPSRSNITILLSTASMSFEAVASSTPGANGEEAGRGENSHVLEALGFYKALTRVASPPDVKFIEDYEWQRESSVPRVVIVPDARVLSADEIDHLKRFADSGNTVILSGLTGLYDPSGGAMAIGSFPLASLTGARLLEEHVVPTEEATLRLQGQTLPINMWKGTVRPATAVALAKNSKGEVTATDLPTKAGGHIIWVPSLIGIGAMQKHAGPLSALLRETLKVSLPVFYQQESGECLVRTMSAGEQQITVVTNGTHHPVVCQFSHLATGAAESVWGEPPLVQNGRATYSLPASGTSVTVWGSGL